jgi:hypothetical protein
MLMGGARVLALARLAVRVAAETEAQGHASEREREHDAELNHSPRHGSRRLLPIAERSHQRPAATATTSTSGT